MWVDVDDLCVRLYESKPGDWEYDRAKAASPMAAHTYKTGNVTSQFDEWYHTEERLSKCVQRGGEKCGSQRN